MLSLAESAAASPRPHQRPLGLRRVRVANAAAAAAAPGGDSSKTSSDGDGNGDGDGDDGRRPKDNPSKSAERPVPWTVGMYLSKRRDHRTNSLGEILDEDDEEEGGGAGGVMEPPREIWNPQRQMDLAITCVADELKMDRATVLKRVEQLQMLVPGLNADRLGTMKVADLARLAAAGGETIAERLVALRDILPSANLASVLQNSPMILLQDAQVLKDAKEAVGAQLGCTGSEKLDEVIAAQPALLQSGAAKAVASLQTMLAGQDIAQLLLKNPSLLFSAQTGDDLIPYDNGSLKQLNDTLAGNSNAAPQGW